MTPEPAGNDNDDNGELVGVSVAVTRFLKAAVTKPLIFRLLENWHVAIRFYASGDRFDRGGVFCD